MNNLIYRLLYFILSFFKKADEYYKQKNRKEYLLKNCIIENGAVVYDDARIQNLRNDPNLILIGKRTHVHSHLMLFGHGGKITIGEDSYLGEDTKIWSAEEIKIGDRVLISHNVNIHDNNSHPIDAKLRHEDFIAIVNHGFQKTNDLNEKPVTIGDDVWIGFNSTILKGVHIGEGAIIAACSLVTKDVAPYTLVGGNPAVLIKNLKKD